MLRNIGMGELLVILVIVVLIFGASRLPQLARGLGEGIREFKKAARDATGEDEKKDAKPDEARKA